MAALPRVRLGGALVDQLLSSASNTLIMIAIARAASIVDFGVCSLAMSALTTVLATTRGLLGTSISLLSSDPQRLRRETRGALSAALLIGVVTAAVIGVAAWASSATSAVLFIAAAAPLVLAQDVGRFYCIAGGRLRPALLSDGVWACGSVLLLAATARGDRASGPAVLLGGWCALALVALLIVLGAERLLPMASGVVRWWTSSSRERLSFGLSAAIAAVSAFAVVGISSTIIGAVASAALIGASTVFGPFNILFSATSFGVVPEIRRRGDLRPRWVWRKLMYLAIPTSLLALLLGLLPFVLPTSLGRLVLGQSWRVVAPVVPLMGMQYAALGWVSAASAGLMALERSAQLVRLRLVSSAISIGVGSVVAATSHSAMAVAAGLVVAAVAGAVYGRSVLLREGREVVAEPTG